MVKIFEEWLVEAFADKYGKHMYAELSHGDLAEYGKTIIDLIKIAYADKGGSNELKTLSDLKNTDLTYWIAKDIDNDPDAVVVAGENVANNRLEGQIEVSTTPVTQITGAYQLVCANIVHDVLVEMAPTLTGLTAVGGQLVLAGILSGEQENNIINVYQEQGCQLLDRRYQEEWVALRLQRADNN
jgi:hypothetical protein